MSGLEGRAALPHGGLPAARRELTNGPSNLCQAFAIDRNHCGADLTRGPLQ